MKISELSFKDHGDAHFSYTIMIQDETASDSLRQLLTETDLIRFKADFIEIWGDVEVVYDPKQIWSRRLTIADEAYQSEHRRYLTERGCLSYL